MCSVEDCSFKAAKTCHHELQRKCEDEQSDASISDRVCSDKRKQNVYVEIIGTLNMGMYKAGH